jgi:hypothetical protein
MYCTQSHPDKEEMASKGHLGFTEGSMAWHARFVEILE